ncbi:hypothetical protein [Halarsenatibacter silvermanii]|uniref:hypothetical protein n=1 Tax=Halarsenatibacter silvermanii TaxID=321763 RepID=UPI001F3AC579|nr:hypothetical protein [Halarsenatibacter silvermanii]
MIISLTFLLLMTALTGCTDPDQPEEVDPDLDEEIDREREAEELIEEPGEAIRDGLLTLYSDDGDTHYLVESEQAVRRQELQEVTFEPVFVSAFSDPEEEPPADEDFEPEREPDYTMEGEFGRYDIPAGELIIPGPSTILSERLRFETHDAVWRQRDDVISSERPTEIFGPDFIAYGQGFTAPGDLESIRLYGDEDEPARVRWLDEEEKENEN